MIDQKRDHPAGTLRYQEFGPGEWLTRKQEPAKVGKREYTLKTEDELVRLDSVSSIVGAMDKPGLLKWYGDQTSQAVHDLWKRGDLDADVPSEDVWERLKLFQVGPEFKKEEASDRGQAVHAAFQDLAENDMYPKASSYPEAWHPWIIGCVRAWQELDPRPVYSELMVCHPGLGYAGRTDLVARVGRDLCLIDWKTAAKGRVYEQAHYQTRGYAEALAVEGIRVDRIVIVAIGDDSVPEVMDCEVSSADWVELVGVFRSRKRVNAGMAVQRRAARKALKEAA